MLLGSGAVSTVTKIQTVVVTSVVVSTFFRKQHRRRAGVKRRRPISAFHNPSEFKAKVKNSAVIIEEFRSMR